MPVSRWTTQLVLFGVAVGALGGCARVVPLAAPTGAASSSQAASASPGDAGSLPTVDVPVPSAATSSGFDEAYPVSCAGRPSGDQIVALLRNKRVLTASSSATVTTGPLCAGTWQYTIVAVTGREPVQVITQGPPDRLELVTVGTDVCTIPVKTQAPQGILTEAHCDLTN